MATTSDHSKTKGIWSWHIVKWIIIPQLLVYAGIFIFGGFDESSNRLCIRFTARLAVLLFSVAFIASTIQDFWKNSFSYWLRFNRKYLGISFALTHLMHLGFLILLQVSFHPVFELAMTKSLAGGGLAYVFVVAMLLTSFDRFSMYLSPKNWKLLHVIGGYWIWFIFFRTYGKKVLADHHEFWPYVVLLVVVLFLRAARLLK